MIWQAPNRVFQFFTTFVHIEKLQLKIKTLNIGAAVFVLTLISGLLIYKNYFASPDIDFGKVIVNGYDAEKPSNLEELQGKVTLVAFFQTWCKDCIIEMPSILRLQNDIANPDFRILMVTDEPLSKIVQFQKRFPSYNFDYYISKNKLPTYGIKKYPTTYLLNSEGEVLKSTLEGYDWSDSEIVALIKKKLTGNY